MVLLTLVTKVNMAPKNKVKCLFFCDFNRQMEVSINFGESSQYQILCFK
jgi:hypothetical protein